MIVTVVGRTVTAQRCVEPGCWNLVVPQTGRGRPRKFCAEHSTGYPIRRRLAAPAEPATEGER